MDTRPSSSTLLSAAEFARFESYILEIAREAKGAGTLASDGPYRFGAKQGLCVYLNGQFHDFSGGPRPHGYGALELVQHLYPNEDPIAWAIAWLAQHPGNGAFIRGEGEPGDDFKEVEATAYINALYNGGALIDDTPGYTYLARPRTDDSPTTRGLPLLPEDQAKLRWVANYRGEEGLLVFPATDDEDKLVKLFGIHIAPDGEKSPHAPARITIRGAQRPGLLRFGEPGPKAIEVEGPEKALAVRARDYLFVVAVGGVSNIGKAPLPGAVQSVVIGRDGDDPGSPSDVALYRGAARRLGQGFKTTITARPNDITPKDAPPCKDLDDLYRYDPEYVSVSIDGSNLEHGRLGEAVDEAIYLEALRLSPGQLNRAARGLMSLLRISTKSALAGEVRRRIDARREAAPGPGAEAGPEPYPDPVTDIGGVLNDAAAEIKKHVAAPDTHFHTAALWALQAHLIHKPELDIDIVARLGFQSLEWNSGKTTFMDAVGEMVPRPLRAGSISGSAMFRAIAATQCTLLCDEIEFLLHADASPEVKAIVNSGTNRAFAFVLRSMPVGDGQFDLQRFSTFAAICFTAIGKLEPPSVQSRCISLPMRPATGEEAKGLKRFRPKHAHGLKACGSKFARWAADLAQLSEFELPEHFVNRIADNWRVLFQIAHAAGGEWPARVLAAAQADADGYGDDEGQSARGADGLLDAIWRVFAAETTDPRRLHTSVLIEKLLNIDEGRWRVAYRGKPVDEYFLRSKLKGYVVLPRKKDASKKADGEKADGKGGGEMPLREWRLPRGDNAKGYHELHFKDAFLRYLGRGLPSEAGKEQPSGDDTSATVEPSPPSATSETGDVSSDKSTISTAADDKIVADDHARQGGGRGAANGEQAERSGWSSATKTHPRQEKAEETVGIEPGVTDVADAWESLSARTRANAPRPLPRGAAGRKRRKE
jgi:hypothetical protein